MVEQKEASLVWFQRQVLHRDFRGQTRPGLALGPVEVGQVNDRLQGDVAHDDGDALPKLSQPGTILGPIFRVGVRGENRVRGLEFGIAGGSGQNFQPVQLVGEPAFDVARQGLSQSGWNE